MYSIAEKESVLDSHAKAILLACRDAIRSEYPSAQIILYGSQARGQAGPESDIDLLVLLPQTISAAQDRIIHDSLYDISLAHDVVISTIIRSEKDWNSPISQASPFYANVQREGIQVA